MHVGALLGRCVLIQCWNSSETLLAVQEDDEAEDDEAEELDAADQDADVSDESLDREEL